MLGAMSVSIAESAFLGAETKELVLGFVFCTLFPHKHLVSFYHRYFFGEQATTWLIKMEKNKNFNVTFIDFLPLPCSHPSQCPPPTPKREGVIRSIHISMKNLYFQVRIQSKVCFLIVK